MIQVSKWTYSESLNDIMSLKEIIQEVWMKWFRKSKWNDSESLNEIIQKVGLFICSTICLTSFYTVKIWKNFSVSVLLPQKLHPEFCRLGSLSGTLRMYIRKLTCHILLKCTKPRSRAGHFRYFLIFSIIKNDSFAFFIKLITYFCTSPF